MSANAPGRAAGDTYLPDLCAPRPALAIIVVVQLAALVLVLARNGDGLGFWTDLWRTSFFLLWVSLTGASILCALREPLARLDALRASFVVVVTASAMVALACELVWRFGHTLFGESIGLAGLVPRDHGSFVARNTAIAFTVTALVLRYFYVVHELRRTEAMQARARVNALQARIRPHFLFNSMNTIASLTRTDPARAEGAVQDLADLFRASLSDKANTIPLAEEIEVARTYERIELLRLGERLRVDWQVDSLPPNALVPALLLQPLLENAIYHGIEPLSRGGAVTISGELSGGNVTLVVRNPVAEGPQMRDGNRVALENIRERVRLVYGDRGLVKAGLFDGEYIVTVRFPHVENAARLTA